MALEDFLSIMAETFKEQRRALEKKGKKKKQRKTTKSSRYLGEILQLQKLKPGFEFFNLAVDKKCLFMTHRPAYTHHSRQATDRLESSDNNNAHQNQFI